MERLRFLQNKIAPYESPRAGFHHYMKQKTTKITRLLINQNESCDSARQTQRKVIFYKTGSSLKTGVFLEKMGGSPYDTTFCLTHVRT